MSVKIQQRPDGTRRVYMDFDENVDVERSRTKPEFSKNSNINSIMKKYKKTGILGDPLDHRQPVFGDFSQGLDFAEAMRKISRVNDRFMSLPASVRSEFRNDPKAMLDFLADPKNDARAIELGLKVAPKKEPLPTVPPVKKDEPKEAPKA